MLLRDISTVSNGTEESLEETCEHSRTIAHTEREPMFYWTRRGGCVEWPTDTRMTVTLSAQPRLTASPASCWQAASYLSSSSVSSASPSPVRCPTAASCGASKGQQRSGLSNVVQQWILIWTRGPAGH